MKTRIHDTAIVDKGASIGEGTSIWHWAHICSGAEIGQDCSIGQNVFVSNKVKIGKNVKIQNNVSVYDNVQLEDDVFCGPSMVFTNVYNPRSFISRKSEYRNTVIKRGATLGANCTVLCGITVGQYAFVGAGTVVLDSVPDFALIVGNPGRMVGWISRYGEQLDLPLNGEGYAVCQYTGEKYKASNGLCSLI